MTKILADIIDDDRYGKERTNHPLEVMYKTDNIKQIFEDCWIGDAELPHGEKSLIATYTGLEDGVDVQVYCVAYPAKFYTIATPNHMLCTGSSEAKLAHDIAKAVSTGMLVIKDNI